MGEPSYSKRPSGGAAFWLFMAAIALLFFGGVNIGWFGASLIGAAVFCAVTATRLLATVVEFYEGGVEMKRPWAEPIRIPSDSLSKMSLEIQRRYGGGSHVETDYVVRLRGERSIRARLSVNPDDHALSERLRVLAERLADRLEGDLEREGAVRWGRMTRLTRDGIEATSTPSLGRKQTIVIPYEGVSGCFFELGADKISTMNAASDYRVFQLRGREANEQVRIDCSDENFHAGYLLLSRRLGEPLDPAAAFLP